jgi:hypothetical protein
MAHVHLSSGPVDSLLDSRRNNDKKAIKKLMKQGILAQQPQLARRLGYKGEGIKKGSFGARLMSAETRACGGRGSLRAMELGGISASLQSVGATGTIKQQAADNLENFQERAAEHVRQRITQAQQHHNPVVYYPLRALGCGDNVANTPEYFTLPANSANLVQLVNYRVGGYNAFKAEQMLNESILPLCESPANGCINGQRFTVVNMQRLESGNLWSRFKTFEMNVAASRSPLTPNTTPQTHPWLKRLAAKNKLSPSANTQYILHGTGMGNLQSITEEGLSVEHAKEGYYGKGVYFTDKSCKVSQYGDGTVQGGRGCILLCRVVLGKVAVVDSMCAARRAPPDGFHSIMAAKGHTTKRNGVKQLHNEFVVFKDEAIYPEFVLTVDFA